MGTAIPTRHPAGPVAVPGLKPFAMLMGIGAPDARRWAAMGESLLIGDQPMDDLVDWMIGTGMADTRPLFEQAVAGGIDSVTDAPQPLRDFFTAVETPPDWLDEEMLRRGEQVLRRGGYDGLTERVAEFFATGVSPAPVEETIEIFAFLAAAEESKARGGAPVSVAEVLREARAEPGRRQ